MVSFPCETESKQPMNDYECEDRSSFNGIEQDDSRSCDLRTALMKSLLEGFANTQKG